MPLLLYQELLLLFVHDFKSLLLVLVISLCMNLAIQKLVDLWCGAFYL